MKNTDGTARKGGREENKVEYLNRHWAEKIREMYVDKKLSTFRITEILKNNKMFRQATRLAWDSITEYMVRKTLIPEAFEKGN